MAKDAYCTKEITSRITMTKSVFTCTLTSFYLQIDKKFELGVDGDADKILHQDYCCSLWSETFSLRKIENKCQDGFELKMSEEDVIGER